MPSSAFPIMAEADPAPDLPAALDCETMALLRSFLAPILEAAPDWPSLAQALHDKGYDLAFRHGHLVVTRLEDGAAICTGSALGVPLRTISARIGRPAVTADPSGTKGVLRSL